MDKYTATGLLTADPQFKQKDDLKWVVLDLQVESFRDKTGKPYYESVRFMAWNYKVDEIRRAYNGGHFRKGHVVMLSGRLRSNTEGGVRQYWFNFQEGNDLTMAYGLSLAGQDAGMMPAAKLQQDKVQQAKPMQEEPKREEPQQAKPLREEPRQAERRQEKPMQEERPTWSFVMPSRRQADAVRLTKEEEAPQDESLPYGDDDDDDEDLSGHYQPETVRVDAAPQREEASYTAPRPVAARQPEVTAGAFKKRKPI